MELRFGMHVSRLVQPYIMGTHELQILIEKMYKMFHFLTATYTDAIDFSNVLAN